jgi:hypothetical protein
MEKIVLCDMCGSTRDGYNWKERARKESGVPEREFTEALKRDWEEFERRFVKQKQSRGVGSGGTLLLWRRPNHQQWSRVKGFGAWPVAC